MASALEPHDFSFNFNCYTILVLILIVRWEGDDCSVLFVDLEHSGRVAATIVISIMVMIIFISIICSALRRLLYARSAMYPPPLPHQHTLKHSVSSIPHLQLPLPSSLFLSPPSSSL